MQIKTFTSILALVLLTLWSCEQSGEQNSSVKEQVPKTEKVQAPKQQKNPSGEVDQYGRKPGDPHYGHNHASDDHSKTKTDSIQKPASGKPDKYGRKPGDPHYGHGHQ